MMLYIDCRSGMNADLMLAALTSLLNNPDDVARMFTSASIHANATVEQGIRVHITAKEHDHGHVHHGLREILTYIDSLDISDRVKDNAKAVFGILGRAEAEVHNMPPDDVHFHEVGSLENVAAVIGICMLVEKLFPERIVSAPICTGFGTVQCAHGVLPVPPPAAASILKDLPNYAGEVEGEMCTPTGAALLAHFVSSFGDPPDSDPKKVGIGLSSKGPSDQRCLRIVEF